MLGGVHVIRIVALLASLLMLLPVVAADFSLNTDITEQTVCATDTILYILDVQNLGSKDTYTVSLSSSASSWAVAAPSGFSLNTNEKESVYVYVTPSSNALPGTYNLLVTVNSQSGKQEQLLTVNVGDCHSAVFTASTIAQDICAANSAEYLLNLANTGKYTETFSLSLSGPAAKFSTISELATKLKAGETTQIKITANPPADQTGSFELAVNAKADNSNAAASMKLSLNSNNCYAFDLLADKNYVSFCENSEVKVPLTVNNKGNLDNSYAISAEGPNWVSVENRDLAVPTEASRTTNLVLFPTFGVSGDFPIKVKADARVGDFDYEQTITANVKTCHSTDVKISTAEDTLCPLTQKAYVVSLSNTGTFDERYVLTVSGADFAQIDRPIIDLEAGKTENVNLLVDTKTAKAGSYLINVKAEAQNPAHAETTDTLNLIITPLEGCFGVQTTSALTQVQVAPGEGSLVPIIIENKGTEESTYNLEVSGTGAAYAKLNPASLTLAGRQARTAYLYISVPQETAQTNYKITVTARIEDGTASSSSNVDLVVVPPTKEQIITEIKEGTAQEKIQTALLPLKAKLAKMRAAIESRVGELNLPEAPKINTNTGNRTPMQLDLPEIKLPENLQSITSAEVFDKLKELKTKVRSVGAERPRESAVNRIKQKFNTILNIGDLDVSSKLDTKFLNKFYTNAKNFFFDKTYNFPNWMWLSGIVIILAIMSYFLKEEETQQEKKPSEKSTWQRFMDWLEEEEDGSLEGKPAETPKAQDVLDELDKKPKKKTTRKKAKK